MTAKGPVQNFKKSSQQRLRTLFSKGGELWEMFQREGIDIDILIMVHTPNSRLCFTTDDQNVWPFDFEQIKGEYRLYGPQDFLAAPVLPGETRVRNTHSSASIAAVPFIVPQNSRPATTSSQNGLDGTASSSDNASGAMPAPVGNNVAFLDRSTPGTNIHGNPSTPPSSKKRRLSFTYSALHGLDDGDEEEDDDCNITVR